MPAQWQIALSVLVGFLVGALCTWLACRITDRSEPPQDKVGADADGQASGAPQGRPPGASGERR